MVALRLKGCTTVKRNVYLAPADIRPRHLGVKGCRNIHVFARLMD